MSKLKFLEKYAVEGRHYDIEKEIDKILDHGSHMDKFYLVDDLRMTHSQIFKALDDSHSAIRQETLRNPNLTNDHITKALDDTSFHVKRVAMNIPTLMKPHIEKALTDNEIKHLAIRHPNYRIFFPNGHETK